MNIQYQTNGPPLMDAIIDYLLHHPKLKGHQDFVMAKAADGVIFTWTEPVRDKTLKIRSLQYMLVVSEDRVVHYLWDFHLGTYLFANPAFPRNLLRSIRLPKPCI